ncbi:hypothetical protein EYF80_043562 [Liparis tanakae]|uniref:Uncharacterized protein n=1 Tax=Liparis tanakae TaxID=230148 RepID=A0A4Z2FYD3_9TELE|nr:hypothetical protein EYF80_043562 [Liparis tanakae]
MTQRGGESLNVVFSAPHEAGDLYGSSWRPSRFEERANLEGYLSETQAAITHGTTRFPGRPRCQSDDEQAAGFDTSAHVTRNGANKALCRRPLNAPLHHTSGRILSRRKKATAPTGGVGERKETRKRERDHGGNHPRRRMETRRERLMQCTVGLGRHARDSGGRTRPLRPSAPPRNYSERRVGPD